MASHRNTGSTLQQDNTLPEGWEMLIDKTTGWPFFVDHINQTTSWQDPRNPTQQVHQQPQATPFQGKPTVREIPIQRQGAPTGYNSPHRGSPAREIPIMREPRDAPPISQPYSTYQAHPQHYGNNVRGNWSAMPQPESQTYSSRSMPQPQVSSWKNEPQAEKTGFWDVPVQRKEASPSRNLNSPASRSSPAFDHQGSTAAQPNNANASENRTQQPTSTLSPPGQSENVDQIRRSPSPNLLTPMENLQQFAAEAEKLQLQVQTFAGLKTDKEYIYLEEMLTRMLIKLDNIDSEGKEEIRNIRRKTVKTVQASLDHLELKAVANASQNVSKSNEQSTNNGMC